MANSKLHLAEFKEKRNCAPPSHFRIRNISCSFKPIFRISDQKLEFVKQTKYLGIHLDKQLT